MQIVLADPPAFTPQYDHELAAALARTGADVRLLTSRFRFGETPAPENYERDERLYPLSSRLFGRSRMRLPLRALEHVGVLFELGRVRAGILHFQWLAWPQLDRRLRLHVPAVFTAHDLLPRRTAQRTRLWRELLARYERVVVHSARGRETLAGLGVEAERLRVIPHPVFPSDPPRADDGRTLLCFGVIRPYKGLDDAIEALRRLDGTRLLVAGDPLEPVEPYRERARGLDVDWRLGYLSQREVDRAFGEATVALFPYRPELDQSGALLRALGAGVPAVAYDVGGIAEPVRRFGAGRVVPAGDVEALAAAARELLDDPATPEAARAGARPARPSRSLPGARMIFRKRFADVVSRQLDLFEREHAGLIADCMAAERAYDRADRTEAEERYGDYVDLVETATELLADLRDGYASTLEGEAADQYETTFNRAVLKRLPRFALEIEDR